MNGGDRKREETTKKTYNWVEGSGEGGGEGKGRG